MREGFLELALIVTACVPDLYPAAAYFETAVRDARPRRRLVKILLQQTGKLASSHIGLFRNWPRDINRTCKIRKILVQRNVKPRKRDERPVAGKVKLARGLSRVRRNSRNQLE